MLQLTSLRVLDFVESYYIYGNGSCGRHLFNLLEGKENLSFKGFVDKAFNNGIQDFNYKTLTPKSLLKEGSREEDCIIVASSFFHEIIKFLSSNGFRRIIIYPERGFETTVSIPSIIFKHHPEIYEDSFMRGGYNNELEKRKVIKKILPYTMVSYDGLLSLAEITTFVIINQISGSIVELGCNKGGCVGLMAKTLLDLKKDKRVIHAFDSFEGLPKSTNPHDDQGMLARWNEEGNLLSSDSFIRELVLEKFSYPEKYLKIHKGWFESTVPQASHSIDKIAILRLDADLYDSTMIGLDYLYPKLAEGGFLILDDWLIPGAQQAILDYFQKNKINDLFRHRVDETVCYWQKNSYK